MFFQTKAQPQANFNVRIIGNDSAKICKQFPFPAANFNDQIYKKQLTDWIFKVQSQGYLSANLDSITRTNLDSKIIVWLGPKYHWLNLKWNTEDAEWAAQTGVDVNNFVGKNIQLKKWFSVTEQILNYAENNGFPFAEIKLDSITIHHDSIAAKIKLDKHLKVVIDSIHCSNNSVVNQKYLYKYLGLKPNLLYNESTIEKLNGLLNSVPFLKQSQPYSVTFIGEHATVNLNLQNQKSSRFNFLLGLLPNNTTAQTPGAASSSKFLLSGEGDLHLENIQSTANIFDMAFRLYPQQTQNLIVKYNHPFLLGLPFGTDGRFEIYKHDSTYIDTDFSLGIQHLLSGRNYLKLFYTTHQSSLTYVDTTTIKATHLLPSNLDYKSNIIGVEWYKEKLNYRFNPSKGFILKFNIGAGYKQFIVNNQISNLADVNFSFSSLYDSIKRPIFHTSFDFLVAKYFTLHKAHILKLQCSGMGTPDKKIFANELQRIGGNRNLRGFDEQSITASLYSLMTIEYRYLLDKNSYAYSFYDVAYTEIKTTSVRQFDKPYGFGVGLAFETKAGIFQMSYALGSRFNNPIVIRNGKIHFGYLVSF
jgi:outer membrane translocation and assembly module TamA